MYVFKGELLPFQEKSANNNSDFLVRKVSAGSDLAKKSRIRPDKEPNQWFSIVSFEPCQDNELTRECWSGPT